MTIKVDARRLLCPMPVIRLQDAVNQAEIGDIIEITCTDPGVKNDIPAWCRINGQQLESIADGDYEIIICVKKCNDD
jgi:tRNA 2-thiouridine synthesizing protein A